MKDKNNKIDPIPESFESVEDAIEFWDTHSLADYEEFLVPVDDILFLQKRTFEVEVSEDNFIRLRARAVKAHQSVPLVLDQILNKELATA